MSDDKKIRKLFDTNVKKLKFEKKKSLILMKKKKIVPQDNKIKRDCSCFFSPYFQRDSYDVLVLSIDRMILENTAKNRITYII